MVNEAETARFLKQRGGGNTLNAPPQWHWCVLPSFPSRARTSLQVMGVRMSKFSATTRTWLHTLSLMLQIGALTNCLTMGGKSATTEQSAPVKPTTDSLLWNHKYSLYWHTHTRITALCPGIPRWPGTGFYWSKRQWVAVASAGPYASLHLAPDR